MERLIQLYDDLDDLICPAFVALTHRHWLRGAALLTLVMVLYRAGAPWALAALLALPALPLGDLVLRHARQRRPVQLSTLVRFSARP